MSGCLIDPKTWDRLVGIYGTCFGQFRGCFQWLCDNLAMNYGLGVFWAGNGHGFRFHKVEPMLGEWATHGQPTAHLRIVKNSPGLLGLAGNGSCVL